jgi:hypothetical protein
VEIITAMDVLVGTATLLGIGLAATFLLSWRRHRAEDLRLRMEQIQIEERRLTEEAHRRAEDSYTREREFDRQLEWQESMRAQEWTRDQERSSRQSYGTEGGGYIIVDLPDERRPLFHDLLKGFEEYATLKGYHVAFSADNSIPNRFAFKFTLSTAGVLVSADQVREDLHEYLERVRSGDDLADLPVVTSIREHDLVVTALRNRISFLRHNYELAKNSVL